MEVKPRGGAVVALPGGEARRVESLLRVGAMRYGQYVWDETNVPAGPTWVRVDLKAQIISVFRGAHEIGTGVILYGADGHPTPRGRFEILAKFEDHRSSTYGAPMPYTLRLTLDGVALHGSDVRRGLATHGCVGMPEAFARNLFKVTSKGDPVYIVPEAPYPGH